jgi:Tol biopolymer transport system component
LQDGVPAGDPQLLRNNVGEILPMGFRTDGLFYYGAINRQVDGYVCQLDPETLKPVAAPARVTDRFIGTNSGASWSPDGQRIAFFRGASRREMSLVVRTVAGGTERTVPTHFTDSIFAGRQGATWMPDGRTLIVPDPAYSEDLWRYRSVDTETGATRVLVEDRHVFGEARVSTDGRYLIYTGVEGAVRPSSKVLRLIRRELASGAESELYRAESEAVSFFGLAVSPDGREIAFMANEGDGRTLNSVPIAGGPRRVLYRGTYSRPSPFGAVWTPDGRYILTVGEASKGGSTILAFPAAGGEPQALDLSMQEILAPSISPDGRHLLFTGAKRQHEVWTIRNLLPRQPVESSAAR